MAGTKQTARKSTGGKTTPFPPSLTGKKDMALTYADRVKRREEWKFKIPADYNKDREVSIKLTDHATRKEIYLLLTSAKVSLSAIEGIVQRPGKIVELTCQSKERALRVAEKLFST
ncbi:unnamed protein product [Clavelina lepadiformis]|uniref:50S ribosomal protein L23 n=1 Tax=Clavelina lepadiformis TaxID=159417 RepID=A0ABP0GD85_CLALP